MNGRLDLGQYSLSNLRSCRWGSSLPLSATTTPGGEMREGRSRTSLGPTCFLVYKFAILEVIWKVYTSVTLFLANFGYFEINWCSFSWTMLTRCVMVSPPGAGTPISCLPHWWLVGLLYDWVWCCSKAYRNISLKLNTKCFCYLRLDHLVLDRTSLNVLVFSLKLWQENLE